MYTLSCNVDQNHGGNQTISSQIEKANMTPVGGKQDDGDDEVMGVRELQGKGKDDDRGYGGYGGDRVYRSYGCDGGDRMM